MKIGPLVRSLLPFTVEVGAASIYRGIFVDLDKVAALLAAELPPEANVLDIGGGDGELLNRLLSIRADIRVTMVDVAASVGRFLKPHLRSRISGYPGMTLQTHMAGMERQYDAVMVIDVMHHVIPAEREEFVRALSEAVKSDGLILIKDVEPGYLRSLLGYLCDRYISGDRNVELVSAEQVSAMFRRLMPGGIAAEIGLLERDKPNYLVRISKASPA